MNQTEAIAHASGAAAATQGSPFGANPYPLGSVNSRAWSRGWRSVAG